MSKIFILSLNKIVAKLLKYRILFKNIHSFLGLNYIYGSLIILYLIVLEIIIPKIR